MSEPEDILGEAIHAQQEKKMKSCMNYKILLPLKEKSTHY